jgi:carboxypeptidase family protein
MRTAGTIARTAIICATFGALLFALGCGQDARNPTSSPTVVPTTTFTLSGTVVETAGPVSDMQIDVLDGLNAGRAAMTDSAGRYTMSGLRASSFQLRASKSGYLRTERSVSLDANTTLDLTVVRACFIAGTVRESRNFTTVSGATVTVLTGPGGSTIVSGPTDLDGYYHLDGIDCNSTRRLRVEKTGFASLEMSVTIGNDTYQDVTIAPL